MKRDRVQEIKDNLARIGVQDTRRVVEVNAAITQMAQLGLRPEDVMVLLAKHPRPADGADDDLPFHGFKNRRQAALAYYSTLPKAERPAGLEDASKRVEALLKNQKPERASAVVGIAVVSIPAMSAAPQLGEAGPAVKRMRRLPSGKLKEITGDVIDVQEAEVESTFVYLERKRKEGADKDAP